MKQKTKLLAVLILAAVLTLTCMPMQALAQETMAATSGTCGDNLTWALDGEGTLTISGAGEMKKPSSWTFLTDEIKTVVMEDGVTTIADYAFAKCNNLSEVSIPDSVTSIGTNAFSYCGSLTYIYIPDSVVSIGEYAFEWCEKLRYADIGENVSSIGMCAFRNCTALERNYIPEGVEAIGEGAFSGCINLGTITLGNVTKIGGNAFRDCGLSNITFPASLTSIGGFAFCQCSELTTIEFLGDAPSIEATDGAKSVFTGVTATAYYPQENTSWTETAMDQLGEGGNITWVPYATSGQCGDNLTWSIDLATATLTISGTGDMWVFSNGNWEKDLPWDGLNIHDVIIEEGVTGIGDYAFQYDQFENLYLPTTLERIGEAVFYYGPRKIHIPSEKDWFEITFESWWSNPMAGYMSGEGAHEIYVGDKLVTELSIPGDVTSIGAYQYADYFLKWVRGSYDLVIPNGVISIGDSAFATEYEARRVSSLRSIVIPASVTTLGAKAFACNGNLEEIYFLGNAPAVAYPSDAQTDYLYMYAPFYCSGEYDTYVIAYYPAGNPTWNEEAMATLGGENIKWVPYEVETTPMYRLYNPYTHEHLLTGSEDEKDQLVNIGWSLDGVAWNSPASGDPVYRLYNPYDDWHTYSMSQEEIENLVSLGWRVDGAVCYSASKESGMPIYRLFNPYEQVNYHMLTASVEERDWLASLGWQPEGVAWYASAE